MGTITNKDFEKKFTIIENELEQEIEKIINEVN
jgi:hypothetical protein